MQRRQPRHHERRNTPPAPRPTAPTAGRRRRRPAPPAAAPRLPARRNDYATGSTRRSMPARSRPTPTRRGMNLADLQAKDVEELRELAAEHGVEGYEELEHSDLVLKLLDVVPLAPSQSRRRTERAARGRHRHPGDRRRGLRLPAPPRRDAVERRHLRQLVPGAPLRAAHRRQGRGPDPPAQGPGEVLGPAAGRHGQRRRPGDRQAPPVLRHAGAGLPRRDVRHRDRPEEPHPAPDQPDQPHRQGPARADPVAGQGRQDHRAEAHRGGHQRPAIPKRS